MREAFAEGLIAINDDESDLDLQLNSREYQIRADRRIALESKEAYTKRTSLPSPDHADSFTMAVWAMMQAWGRLAAEGA